MSPEYLAGFFDGEGCIDAQITRTKKYEDRFYVRTRVRVAQAASGRIILDKLQATFGGLIFKRKAQKTTQQSSASWEFQDRDGVIRMLRTMLPFLVIKKEQAKLALWWSENSTGLYGGKGHRPNLIEARKLFYHELQLMKLDPQRLSERAVERIVELMR